MPKWSTILPKPILSFLKHKKRIKPLKECNSRRLHAFGIPSSPSFQRHWVHEVCVPPSQFLVRLQHPSSTLLPGILLTSSRKKLHTRKNQSDRESLRWRRAAKYHSPGQVVTIDCHLSSRYESCVRRPRRYRWLNRCRSYPAPTVLVGFVFPRRLNSGLSGKCLSSHLP